VAQQIVATLDESFLVRGHTLRVTASIGIACAPRDGHQYGTLLKYADTAMYRAKRRGQAVGVYDAGSEVNQMQRLQLESDLRAGLIRDELILYYQPICELPSKHISRVEALVRWNHPELGMVPPGIFIPIAEECGLIRDLDRWVLRHAIAQVATWAAQGYALSVTINLSAYSLQDRTLTAEIAAMLRASSAPAERVIVEVTESTAMTDIETTQQVLQQLNALGICVAIDDFGSGHASLGRLKHLPVEILKVDRTFVMGIGSQPKDEGILQALVTLSRGLGLTIVAEGVETPEQLQWLSQAGYAHVQGYLLGMPMPPEQLIRTLNETSQA
jgi:EAL domain-containing protein (putative c-di-GMP-specific phosphodiesterase class I)